MMVERPASQSKGQDPLDPEAVRAFKLKFYDENYPNWREIYKRRSKLADIQSQTFGKLMWTCDLTPEGPFFPFVFRVDQRSEQRFGVYVGWQVSGFEQPAPYELRPLEEFTAKLLVAARRCSPERLSQAGYRLFNNQCEGTHIGQRVFIAREIEPTLEFKDFAKDICLKGWMSISPDATVYNSALSEFGLDEQKSPDTGVRIVEAVYPIALSENNLGRITGSQLTVAEALAPLGGEASLAGEARIYIIADNSD